MRNSILTSLILTFICAILLGYNLQILPYVQAQIGSNTVKPVTTARSNEVTVTSSFSTGVSNETLKTKEGTLRNAVIGFLNSGPNVLKSSPTDQPQVKTKIENQISNATQNVEGIEATNAILAVELGKALKAVISSADSPAQTVFISISTTSKCFPTGNKISCDNSVTLK